MKENNIIEEKSFEFAVRVVNLYKYLTSEKQEFVMSKQLLRSGTSIGANNAEATNAISKADFKSKSFIALKEAREVTEQRVESQACLSYPESRRNSTKSKPLLDRFAT